MLANNNSHNNNEEIIPCKYIESNNLVSICRSQNLKNKFLSLNVNIRSLVKNNQFSSLESLVFSLKVQPHVIGINETWKKSTSSGNYKNLNGYSYISNYKSSNSGGGVGLFIKNDLNYSKQSKLSIMKEAIF